MLKSHLHFFCLIRTLQQIDIQMPSSDIVSQIKFWLFIANSVFHDFESTLDIAMPNVHLSPLTIDLAQLINRFELLECRFVVNNICIFKFFILIVK